MVSMATIILWISKIAKMDIASYLSACVSYTHHALHLRMLHRVVHSIVTGCAYLVQLTTLPSL